jgi:putative transposase
VAAVAARPMLRVLANQNLDELARDVRPRRLRRAEPAPTLPVGYRGRYLRRLLEPRRPVELVLRSVIQQTYLAGAGTRTVDALAEKVGATAADPESVEKEARDWDERVDAFLGRPLKEPYRYLLLTQTTALVRESGTAEPFAVVVAIGVTGEGRRAVIGLAVTPADQLLRLWHPFFADLAGRGLRDVELVMSDRLDAILPAVAEQFPEARWQRCREDFVAEALRSVPRGERPPVAAGLRAVFVEPDVASALQALADLRRRFEFGYRELVARLEAPVGELLAHYQVPPEHRRIVSSSRALAPLRRELRRAAKLVGIFPDRLALRRLAGIIAQDSSDEWVARRRHGHWSRVRRTRVASQSGDAMAMAGWAA